MNLKAGQTKAQRDNQAERINTVSTIRHLMHMQLKYCERKKKPGKKNKNLLVKADKSQQKLLRTSLTGQYLEGFRGLER